MRFPILMLGAILASSTAEATGYVQMTDLGVSVGVNPTGKYVFGYNGRSGDESQLSWIFDTDTKTTSQYPSDAVSDSDFDGQLMWLTSANVGVGTYRDEEWATEVSDGQDGSLENYPLNTACIWKDGKKIGLDHNKWEDASTFKAQDGTLPNAGNGFYAMRMSDDESTILGYLKAFTYMLPVRWTRNADGTYTSKMMHREVGEFFYYWVGASADCSRMILNNSQSEGQSYIWDGDSDHWIFTYSESESRIENPYLTALSPNGKKAIMSCTRNGLPAYGVYDFDTKSVEWIPVPEGAASTNWFAATVVTDNGDGFISDYNYVPHFFSVNLGINIPLSAYLQAFGDDIATISSLPNKALVRMVSADGRTICGNSLQFSLETAGWLARLPEKQPLLFALRSCSAMYASTESVLVKWIAPTLPEGAKIKNYAIELDGELHEITDATKDADGYTRVTLPCELGEHQITLYAVAIDSNGKEWESVHQDLELNISLATDLFFFEDLCDSRVDETAMAYVYTHDTFKAAKTQDSAVSNFRLDAGDFYNLTPFWYTCGFSNAEWHSYLESRWFDASSQTDDFYFTWQERNMTINSATELDENNTLSVEYTTDGENWTPLSTSNGKTNNAKWNAQVVDLSSLAGEKFRLRFHAKGAGKHACEWRVDYYGIMPASAIYDAPADLMITEVTSNGVNLAWKNNRGQYEVSYNFNSPMTYNNNIGNAGQPLYVACDYGPAKLKAFEGKYITSVSTLIYEPASVAQAEHTKVQAVVFDQDGKELSRGSLADNAPWYEAGVSTGMPIHNIDLDTPVLIEPGKTYRVSILITDYEPEMCPIWYFSASDDYIPGVTDLYSDDKLETWNTISDLYSYETDENFNLYGRCIFNICPGISDTPTTATEPYCQDQWFYQVYRNGEQIPAGISFFTQQTAVDNNFKKATYSVRSFRRDGSVSEMSDAIVFEGSGINSVVNDAPTSIKLVREGENLFIAGEFDSVTTYNLQGLQVATSRVVNLNGLPRGIYIIRAKKDGNVYTAKFAY